MTFVAPIQANKKAPQINTNQARATHKNQASPSEEKEGEKN